MKLNPRKGNGGHITSYSVILGSKQVRDAGFINEDGTAHELKKIIDTENKRIIILIDDKK